jgi:hypothetical protein
VPAVERNGSHAGNFRKRRTRRRIEVMKRKFMPSNKFTLFWFALMAASAAFADQITLSNGDRLTGTVLKSDGKELVLKTDYAGEIKKLVEIAPFRGNAPQFGTRFEFR